MPPAFQVPRSPSLLVCNPTLILFLRHFTGWEVDIEDHFLSAWTPRWLILKSYSNGKNSSKPCSFGEVPEPKAASPGSSMIVQGRAHPWRWWRLDFAHFVHYLCNMMVVRECGCRWFIGRSRRKQIAGAQLLFLGCPWVSPPPPALLALSAYPTLSWLLWWT